MSSTQSTDSAVSEVSKEEEKKPPQRERTIHSRAVRRALQNIIPENSHPQLQSPLFSVLPGEIRTLIFTHALSQCHISTGPVSAHHKRPGHTHGTYVSTTLLRTCRRVYFEAHAIPLRSTTHHVYEDPKNSFNPADWDFYLYHLSSQSGRNLHHLHITTWTSSINLESHLIPHLHWRKISWTLCTSEMTFGNIIDLNWVHDKMEKVGNLPASCQEFNLEFESLMKLPQQRQAIRTWAEKVRMLKLGRRDGTVLDIDEAYSFEYTWQGETWKPPQAHRGHHHWDGWYDKAVYHVIRICWRKQVHQREYMFLDRVDCLRGEGIDRWTAEGVEKDKEGISSPGVVAYPHHSTTAG